MEGLAVVRRLTSSTSAARLRPLFGAWPLAWPFMLSICRRCIYCELGSKGI